MTVQQVRPTDSTLINLIPEHTGFSVSTQADLENCRYMKLKLGTMPFFMPCRTQDGAMLRVGCRPFYGKDWRGKMISSPHTLSRLLLEELQLAVGPCQGWGEDDIVISGSVPEEYMYAALERMEIMVSEMIQ